MHRLLILSVILLVRTSFGQIEEVRRITETLCSPEFHGRGYVNRGDSIAAAFIADEFKKLDVQPFGDDYFQPFTLNVNTFPGEMFVANDGNTLVPGKDFVIHHSSMGGAETLKALEIPAERALDIEFIKEAIGIVRSGKSENCLLFDLALLSGDELKQGRAISQEVATIVPVIQLVNEKFTWSVSQQPQTVLFLQIQDSVVNKLAPFEVNIESKRIENYPTQNVMAYIPGSRKCGKTIVFTAHYDHLGRMGRDTYFPGANDNASGTAMLFTMAKYFKENPTKFNILFIAFAGEEAGLVGSKFFVENTPIKLKKIRFLVNLDIMGSGEEGITAVNGTLFEKEFEMLQKINSEKELLAKIKKRGPAANSDHYWFTEAGVPAFFIYTMGPNKHYHDIFDVYEDLSFKEYHDITTLLVDFVKMLE